MIFTCPCCHARYSLDAANQDEAARELLALRGDTPPRLWNPLIAYLGLFRSESRALAWDRALKLAREVMELARELEPGSGGWERLENALAATVESLRLKGGKPLKNHNYLKRVLEDTTLPVLLLNQEGGADRRGVVSTSKRAAALSSLAEWGAGDWLRAEIAAGLQALVAQSLKGQPAAEMITLNADVWHVALNKILTIEQVDAGRIRKGWERLFAAVKEWPTVKQLIELLPSRPIRTEISRPRMTDADFATNAQRLQEVMAAMEHGE